MPELAIVPATATGGGGGVADDAKLAKNNTKKPKAVKLKSGTGVTYI